MTVMKIFLVILLIITVSIGAFGQRSVELYNKGVEAAKRSEFPVAIKYFSKAIQINSLFKEAYFNLALAQSRLGDYQRSIENYSHVLAIDPDFTLALLNRGADKLET